MNRCAPGPPGHFLFGHLREFRGDILSTLLNATRQYGDVVRFRLGPQVVHLVNHPDWVQHVLQRRAQNYDKQTRSVRFIREVCGESLLTSTGTSWQTQKKTLQPYFHQQSVRRFADLMTDKTFAMLGQWRRRCELQDSFDMASEMMRLTYGIAVKAFFNAEAGPDSETIERAMNVIMPYTFGRLEHVVNLPTWVPTRANRRFRQALDAVDRVVYRLIEQHRANQSVSGRPIDLLGLLTAEQDDRGRPLADQSIRDQTITFLLAGHETTSNALSWTMYLLAQHPEVQHQIRTEIGTVVGKSGITLEDLPKLVFGRQVIRESMRLFPPIWIIERRVIEEDQIGGFKIPAGSAVVVCPYTLHRHPSYWEKAEEFLPERFAQKVSEAYIPFGAGPRYCIGSEFAMLEAQIIIALILREFSLELIPGKPARPQPGITLRTQDGMPMRVTPVSVTY